MLKQLLRVRITVLFWIPKVYFVVYSQITKRQIMAPEQRALFSVSFYLFCNCFAPLLSSKKAWVASPTKLRLLTLLEEHFEGLIVEKVMGTWVMFERQAARS